jgi:hypothetical protein
VAAYDLSLAIDDQVGVEEGAQRLGYFFVDPHDDHGVCPAGAPAELFGCRAGNRHGVFDEFTKILFPAKRVVQSVPVRIAGDENLGKDDEPGAPVGGLEDQPACLFHGGLAVEEYRSGLDSRGFEFRKGVSHG